VTFAEPEIGNNSFSDPESSSSTNARGRESEMHNPSDLDVDVTYCCCDQSSMQPDQALHHPGPIDRTTPSDSSFDEQQEITDEDANISDSNEEIAEGDEDSDDFEQNQDSEDRGFQMPDPEIRNSFTECITTTTVTRSVSSFSIGLRSPSFPSSGTYGGPPPPEEFNCLDIDGFLRTQNRRPPPRPNHECRYVNDMMHSQSVYMSDYRPIIPGQFNQGYGPQPFNGGRRFREMPMRGGFEPRYPYPPDMPIGGGFEGRYPVPTEPIFIGPHPEGGFEVNYAFPPDPFSSNPWVGSCPPPVPNPFPYSPCYSTGIYGTGANCMDPQGRHCPNCSGYVHFFTFKIFINVIPLLAPVIAVHLHAVPPCGVHKV